MSLQVEWQYIMLTVPGIREYMRPVEEALANKFLLKLLGIQSISGRLRDLPAQVSKRAGIKVPNQRMRQTKSTRLHSLATNVWWIPSSQESPYRQSNIEPVSREAEGKGWR